jgi:hypothetical protein
VNTIAELEQNLDVPTLLDMWGVDTSGMWQVSRDEWRSPCFIHGGDGHTALSIKRCGGRWYVRCFSHDCFRGTLVDYGLTTGRTFQQILSDYEVAQSGCGTTSLKRPPANQCRQDSVGSNVLPPHVMEQFEPSIHVNLIRDGYDGEMLRDVFDVRFCADPCHQLYGRIVYPVRDKFGRIVSIQGRRTKTCGLGAEKYQFLAGHPAKHILYGAWEQRERIRRSRYIVVAESPKSVWRGYQLGFPVLALMGIRFTDQQVRAIAAYGRRVILAADADQPGINGMVELERELRRYVDVRVVVCPDDRADISDYKQRDEWMRILGV